MAVRRLDNASWGFASNCFVCEAGNERGLRIPFFHDDEADVVTADFALDAGFSGAPSYLHGGVTLAILDEAMAWASIASAGTFALTGTTTTTFLRPVRVDRTYRVEARVAGTTADGHLEVTAVVRDPGGRACAEARATFLPMTAGQAGAAIGEVAGDDARYVRG